MVFNNLSTIDNPIAPFEDIKGNFPVKIGAPSYVWPQGYAENVSKLKPVFSEIQLLMFETLDKSAISPEEIALLQELKGGGLTYSLHLPAPSRIAAPGGNSVETLLKVIDTMKPLDITNYVLHIEPADGEMNGKLASSRIIELTDKSNIDPRQICVENLPDVPFGEVWEAVRNTGVSICIDAGHLILKGEDPLAFLERYGSRIRMAHIHGVADRDHRSLKAMNAGLLFELISRLSDMKLEGAVIIETYSLDEIIESLQCLKAISGRFVSEPVV